MLLILTYEECPYYFKAVEHAAPRSVKGLTLGGIRFVLQTFPSPALLVQAAGVSMEVSAPHIWGLDNALCRGHPTFMGTRLPMSRTPTQAARLKYLDAERVVCNPRPHNPPKRGLHGCPTAQAVKLEFFNTTNAFKGYLGSQCNANPALDYKSGSELQPIQVSQRANQAMPSPCKAA